MFDLVDQPWIPVRDADGSVRDVSLLEVFREAPGIRELAIGFPLELVATTRLLVAVLQSALDGPVSIKQKRRWLDAHADASSTIEAYLEGWRRRFDLFDPQRPFLQQLVGDDVSLLPISALRADWSSGNNVTLFDHHVDRQPEALDAGSAARALLTTLLFQPGGGVSKPFNRTDSPGTKALHAFVVGGDLWRTLVLNAPNIPGHDDARPSWEEDDDADRAPNSRGTVSRGWLDRVTWRSRAIRLERDDDGLVRRCRVHQHLKLLDGYPFDPFAPVRYAEGKEPTMMRASPSRAIWRDAESLLRGLVEDGNRSTVVAQAVKVLGRGELPVIRIVGQVVAQAKIADVRDARLPVSAALLADDARLALVEGIIVDAEAGAKALRAAVKRYSDELGGGPDGWSLATPYEVRVWAALVSPFHDALARIASADQPPLTGDPLVTAWRESVVAECRRAYAGLQDQAGAGPRAVKALAVGRRTLEGGLSKITPDQKDDAA